MVLWTFLKLRYDKQEQLQRSREVIPVFSALLDELYSGHGQVCLNIYLEKVCKQKSKEEHFFQKETIIYYLLYVEY